MKRPLTCVNLNKAIYRLAGAGDSVRLSRALADVVVAQMLPDGVVKGGSSLLFRYGPGVTRYTRDVDAARATDPDEYRTRLSRALAAGWNGFSGRLVAVPRRIPKNVPAEYAMVPYDVKLDYCGRPWQTVRVEVGHDEIGDADEFEEFLPAELGDAFEWLGFPRPAPVRVMKLGHQIAQKLHAVSAPRSERAHDLIDLQLMVARSAPDLADVRAKCLRLFAYRKRQPWPPHIEAGPGWDALYAAALADVTDRRGVLPTVEEAVAWANALVAKIDAATP